MCSVSFPYGDLFWSWVRHFQSNCAWEISGGWSSALAPVPKWEAQMKFLPLGSGLTQFCPFCHLGTSFSASSSLYSLAFQVNKTSLKIFKEKNYQRWFFMCNWNFVPHIQHLVLHDQSLVPGSLHLSSFIISPGTFLFCFLCLVILFIFYISVVM